MWQKFWGAMAPHRTATGQNSLINAIIEAPPPQFIFFYFFITNTKEFASFCLCVLYSGRSTVHAETPFSRICDK